MDENNEITARKWPIWRAIEILRERAVGPVREGYVVTGRLML